MIDFEHDILHVFYPLSANDVTGARFGLVLCSDQCTPYKSHELETTGLNTLRAA
jgi:hypothetical protein